MALLEVLKFPDTRLRTRAQPVVNIRAITSIVDDMFETMYHYTGVGLAATQVNIHYRVFVLDISETRKEGMCIINPEMISQSGIQYENEGCLSVGGGAFEKIKRAQNLHLRAMDLSGKSIELKVQGLMAACIQHEIDHLNGILFIDHLSRLKQDRIRSKIKKEYRAQECHV